MIRPFVDFHIHTTASGGRLSPEEVLQAAYAAGIRVMSITDHDYTMDLTELRKTIPDDMTLIQGAEVSALYVDGRGEEHDLHIVALGFDPENAEMAQLLIPNAPSRPALEKVIRCIIRSGGTPVLCKLLTDYPDCGNEDIDSLVRRFSQLVEAYGGRGAMEVYYTRYSSEERLYLLRLCMKYGLMISSGSDYHAQEEWETLEHRISSCACSELLEHLGIRVNYSVQPGNILVVSGFSGVGKGTVCKELVKRTIDEKPVILIRSVTNRAPRSENENYTFVSREKFAELAATHQLLEYNDAYSGNGYGTPVEEVRRALEVGIPLLEIDRVGLCRLLTDGKLDPRRVKSVFVAAQAHVTAQRLCSRGTETREQIRRRLQQALTESRYIWLYDAVVINDTVGDAVRDVIAAFEGNPPDTDFDPAAFHREMQQLLSDF